MLSESLMLYTLQAVLIAGVICFAFRDQSLVLRLQVLAWLVGTLTIAWRYGPGEQTNFYSNDQSYYWKTLDSFAVFGVPWDVDMWLHSKLPYTVAALPLAAIGIHPTLALKTVSLICLMALSRRLLSDARSETLKDQAVTLWLTACGLIGTFFSLLALRETMMMYFVYRFATDRSTGIRLFSLVVLYLLRPHLAAAVFAAEVVMLAWRWVRGKRQFGAAESPMLISFGAILGTTLFSWGVGNYAQVLTPFSGGWGIAQATRVASNFVGLQFLTVREETVEFSIARLLLLRIVLNETIVIPMAFIAICLFASRWLNDRDRFTLLVFTIYASVVIGTDFNSFRQNIPLMPLIGLSIVRHLASRRAVLRKAPITENYRTDAVITPSGT
jgi:hypothetical protein